MTASPRAKTGMFSSAARTANVARALERDNAPTPFLFATFSLGEQRKSRFKQNNQIKRERFFENFLE
ncbi:MAG: hypothetical protein IJG24_07120 [Selenomonadaceae bacterium]|nr:hypothetical protein [Selenomonadaceae bacterium]